MRKGMLRNVLSNLKRIAVHSRIHLDEVVAVWLIFKFGGDLIKNLHELEIIVWPSGNSTPDGKSVRNHILAGLLPIGVGGGVTDEHSRNGSGHYGKSSAEIIAELLGVQNLPELKQILKMVHSDDVEGSSSFDQLGPLVLALSNEWADSPKSVVDYFSILLDALYERQCRFVEGRKEIAQIEKEARKERDDYRVQSIWIHGEKLRLITIESDNDQIVNSAWSRGYDAVIKRCSSGHTQVLANKRVTLAELDRVATRLRINELHRRGKGNQIRKTNLSLDGHLSVAPEWYYQREAGRIMNGCHSATGVSPTRLSLEDIRKIVLAAINPPGRKTVQIKKREEGGLSINRVADAMEKVSV